MLLIFQKLCFNKTLGFSPQPVSNNAMKKRVKVKGTQPCPALCNPMDHTQSMEFSRPEHWRGELFPPPGDHPNPGFKPRSPALQVDSLPAEPPGKPKNTGVGSLSLLQGSSWPRIKPGSPALQVDYLSAELLGKLQWAQVCPRCTKIFEAWKSSEPPKYKKHVNQGINQFLVK